MLGGEGPPRDPDPCPKPALKLLGAQKASQHSTSTRQLPTFKWRATPRQGAPERGLGCRITDTKIHMPAVQPWTSHWAALSLFLSIHLPPALL